jgi:outer membrane protein assembly factor BamA
LLRYPFSLFSRIDLNIFYEHSKRDPYLFKNNKLEHNDSLPDISLNITLPSLSYVYDNTLWGITGPIRGIRGEATLLVSPAFTAKDASFFSIDCDLRHYLHINRRFVWANRITCGFSEPIGQEESQRRYFLGGNEYWLFPEINFDKYEKNYTKSNYSSFVVPFRGWDYFDITGTRYIVWNTEFRFPFIKTIQVVWPLPFEIRYINGALFIDMGNAWDPADQYPVIPLPKTIYGGFGFGMRANFGIFVLRYDLAWQTDWRTYVKKHVHHYFSLGAEF